MNDPGIATANYNSSASGNNVALKLEDLQKDYFLKGETVHALNGVSFEVPEGDFVSIMGPSGSGKTTLANIKFQNDRVIWDDYDKLEELLKWLKENNY